MAGNDLADMDKSTKEILMNKEVIALDQDPLGIPAMKFIDFGDREVWIKPLENDEFAYCFLNRGETDWELDYDLTKEWLADPDFDWKRYSIDGNYKVRDLWKHKDLGKSGKPYKGTVPPHDVVVLRLSK